MELNAKTPRTKQALQEAMISLLQTTPLSDITITALCRKARVGRATFYRSYNEPLDVILERHSDAIFRVREDTENGNLTDRELLIRGLSVFVKTIENRRACANILNYMTPRQRDRICGDRIFRSVFLDRMPEETARYFRVIVTDVLSVWLEEGKETPEEIAALLSSLARAAGGWQEKE